MSVYDLYQSYLNQIKNPVMQSAVFTPGLMGLPQAQTMQQGNDQNLMNMVQPGNIDYTQVPSMLSQYMRPSGIMDYAAMAFNPVGYTAFNLADYARDQAKSKDVQDMGIGFGGATSGDRAGGGGFGGDTAGGFSESDPTATEGSF